MHMVEVVVGSGGGDVLLFSHAVKIHSDLKVRDERLPRSQETQMRWTNDDEDRTQQVLRPAPVVCTMRYSYKYSNKQNNVPLHISGSGVHIRVGSNIIERPQSRGVLQACPSLHTRSACCKKKEKKEKKEWSVRAAEQARSRVGPFETANDTRTRRKISCGAI